MEWFSINLSTILVTAILVVLVVIVLLKLLKDQKEGTHSCTSNCGACPFHDQCHDSKKPKH